MIILIRTEKFRVGDRGVFFFGDFDSRRERVSERLLRTNTDDARKAHPLHSENTHTHTHSLMLEVTRVICLPSLSKGTKKKQ